MKLIAEGLLDTAQPPHLVGGRRLSDGQVVFPLPRDSREFEPCVLSREGTLWSYTVQRFCPKSPFLGAADESHFQPYAVGYIELPEVIVEARIDTDDFSTLSIGQAMRLVIVPFATDAAGAPLATYAFQPIGRGN